MDLSLGLPRADVADSGIAHGERRLPNRIAITGSEIDSRFALLEFIESHHDAGTSVGSHSVPVSQMLGQALRPGDTGRAFGDLPEVRSDDQDATHRHAGSRGRVDPAGSASRSDWDGTTKGYRSEAVPMAEERWDGAAKHWQGVCNASPSHQRSNHWTISGRQAAQRRQQVRTTRIGCKATGKRFAKRSHQATLGSAFEPQLGCVR